MASVPDAIKALVDAERRSARRYQLYMFAAGPSLRAVWERQANEEADRQAWLAGVQKRLGLLTRADVDALLAYRLAELGSATWPS